MVEQITFQTVFQFLQTAGILVGVYYYITTLRNAQKNRKSEVLWSFLALRRQQDSMLKYAWSMELDWEDYEDFQRKYGRKNNPEDWSRLWSYLVQFDDIGLMVKRGVIDISDYYELASSSIPSLWIKFKPIILEERRRGDPKTMEWLEYLVKEMRKESIRIGDDQLRELEL